MEMELILVIIIFQRQNLLPPFFGLLFKCQAHANQFYSFLDLLLNPNLLIKNLSALKKGRTRVIFIIKLIIWHFHFIELKQAPLQIEDFIKRQNYFMLFLLNSQLIFHSMAISFNLIYFSMDFFLGSNLELLNYYLNFRNSISLHCCYREQIIRIIKN